MSITASSLSKIGILSVLLESNKIVFGPGPTPLEELTALLQIRWSTLHGSSAIAYTVPVFLPLHAFSVVVI